MIHIRLEEHGGFDAPEGIDLLQALTQAGFFLDAPCGGQGKCGKCRVLVDGEPQLACRYTLTGDITVRLPQAQDSIYSAPVIPDQARPQNDDERKVGLAK